MADQQSPPAEQPPEAARPERASGAADSPGRRDRPGRTMALWGGAAALVLVAGGVAIGTVNATVYSPEAQVERYLDALADGDGATALGLARGGQGSDGAGLAPGTATTLLDGEPLAAGFAALQHVTVSRGGESRGGVEVVVGYRVDGRDHSTTFAVERVGRDWLFFDRWRMAPAPLRTVHVSPANLPPEAASEPLEAHVNGTTVPLGPREAGAAPGRQLAVLPPFVVEAGFTSDYLEAGPTRAVVDASGVEAPSAPLDLVLELQYTDAVQEEVDAQLSAYLEGCTSQQVLHPSGCPMGYDTVNRIPPDSITWSVSGTPRAAVMELPAGGEDPTEVAAAQADAVLAVQEIDLVSGERRAVERREPFTLEAELAVTPNAVRYTPRVP
ncbi:MAG: hypothetical protein QJR09_08700 [Micrococcus sp.]|nr:hypothetical protein [Micrococcus sp.]